MRARAAPDPRYSGRMYTWEIIRKFPSGREYFKDLRSGRVGLADESGRRPHNTSTGVLWLDTTGKRCIVGPLPAGTVYSFRVPLLDVEQQKKSTWVTAVEAMWLSACYKLKIRMPLSYEDFFMVECKIKGVS